MKRFQVIYRAKDSFDPWQSMGTTFDSRSEAIAAAKEYDERWNDREHTVVELTPERVTELDTIAAPRRLLEDCHAKLGDALELDNEAGRPDPAWRADLVALRAELGRLLDGEKA